MTRIGLERARLLSVLAARADTLDAEAQSSEDLAELLRQERTARKFWESHYATAYHVSKWAERDRARLRVVTLLALAVALIEAVALAIGGRHSRRTVTRFGVSVPTADRWLAALRVVPGVVAVREGRTTWLEWRRPKT